MSTVEKEVLRFFFFSFFLSLPSEVVISSDAFHSNLAYLSIINKIAEVECSLCTIARIVIHNIICCSRHIIGALIYDKLIYGQNVEVEIILR